MSFIMLINLNLTKPSTINPAYLYENQKIFVKPTSIIDRIKVDYIRKPNKCSMGIWSGGLGQYQKYLLAEFL